MADSQNLLRCMPVTLESSNQAFGSPPKSEIGIHLHQSNSEISDVYASSLSGRTNTEHACSYSNHSTGKTLPQRLLVEEAAQSMTANRSHCPSSDGLSSVSSVWPQNATTEFSSFLSPFSRMECEPHSTKIQDFSLVFPKSDANNQAAHVLLTCSSSSSSFQSSGVTRPAAYVVGPKTKSIQDETAAQSHLVKISQIDSAGHELGCSITHDAFPASGSVTKFQCAEKQSAASKGLEPLSSSSDGNLVISTTSLQSPSMPDGNLSTAERPKKLMGTKIVQRNHSYECSSLTHDCEAEQPASTTTCAADENEPIVTQISVDHGEDSCVNELVSSSTASTENLEGVADSSTPTLERRALRKPANKTKPVVNVLAKIAALGTEPDRQQFLENLFTFMESRGTPVTILPVICRQAVDLYKLYHLVKERGGMVEISKGKRWRDVASAIGIGGSTSAGFTLKRNYGRYLFPYECKFDRDDIDPVPLLAAMETPRKDSKRKAAEKEIDIGLEESQSSFSHLSPRAVQSVRTLQNSDVLIAQSWQADVDQMCNDTRDTGSSVSCSSSILLPCSESRAALGIAGYQMGTLCAAGNASSSSSENSEPKSELCVSSSYTPLQSVRTSRLADDRKSSDYIKLLSPVTSQSRNSLTFMLPNGQSEVGLMGFQLSTSVQGFVRQEKDNSISSRMVTSESECKVDASDSIGSLLTPQLAASRQAICTTSSSQNSCSGKNSKFHGIKVNREIGQQNAQLKSSLEISSTDGNWEIVRNNSNIGPTNQGLNGQNASTTVVGLCSPGSDSKPSGLQLLQDAQLCPTSQKNLRSNKTDVSISRYDTIFPPDSIEAEQPIHKRKLLLTHKDIGLVDIWRVMMCLRSGLIAESTWAIDVLSVLLHDNYTASAFCLNSLPGLLEILLEYLRRYLIETFGAEHFRSQEVFNPSIEPPASIDSDNSVLSGTGLLTRICRKRKASENNEVSEINPVLSTCDGSLGSDGDIDAVFDSSAADWQMGCDDSAIHIMTHIATDNNSFHEEHFFGKNNAYLKSESSKCHFSEKLLANERFNMTINSIDSRISNDGIHKSSASRASLSIKTEEGIAFEDNNLNISPNGFNNCSDSVPTRDNDVIQKHSSEANLLEDMTCQRVFRLTCSHLESLKSISSDIDEETDEPDDHLVLCHDDSKAEIASRGLCISRLIRNLSLINGNEIEMAKHHGLIFIISKLLLLHHSHRERRADYKQSANRNADEAGHKWWWDTLAVLREHCLVILTSISGQLDLSSFPESICLPLLDSLLHWSICQSSEACDPLPGSTLSVSHLVLETLSKLCVVGSNVDMIIATPPFSRIVLLLSHLSNCLSDKNRPVVRELSLGLVSRMVQANDSAARVLALERSAICYVFEFIEGAERRARMVASTQGIEMLQDFPETIGTSVDMLCRAANVLHHLAQIPANKSTLLLYQNRFLQLIMSQILDCKVTTILADVFGIINST